MAHENTFKKKFGFMAPLAKKVPDPCFNNLPTYGCAFFLSPLFIFRFERQSLSVFVAEKRTKVGVCVTSYRSM